MTGETYDLFENSEFPEKPKPKKTGLTIVKTKNKPLTKAQKKFNDLTKQIEKLHENIKLTTERFEAILQVYTAEMPEVSTALARTQAEFVKVLHDSTGTVSYGKRQRENLGRVILDLCDFVFTVLERDDETEKIFNAWSHISFEEEAEFQITAVKDSFAEEIKEIFGFDFDLSELENTPESIAEFQQKFSEEYSKKQAQERQAFSGRKKTAKQIQQEELLKQQEELKLKSVRNIYLSLAKVLHPDMVTDAEEKLIKEDLMKKVTAAYKDNDLATLLRLEMEYVSSEHNDPSKLSDEKLELYISALKEQVAVLENELHAVRSHPRFIPIMDYVSINEKYAKELIYEDVRNDKARIRRYEKCIKTCLGKDKKQAIMSFVNDYVKELDEAEDYMSSYEDFMNVFGHRPGF
jgi:hypothetical protein